MASIKKAGISKGISELIEENVWWEKRESTRSWRV